MVILLFKLIYIKKIKAIVIIILIGIIFIFSWLQNPDFKNIYFIPTWLNNWSNDYGRLRTAIPFIPLGFILNTYQKNRIFSINGLLISLFVVVISECGQFFLPARNSDIYDVLFGLLGSILGMGIQKFFFFHAAEI